MYEYNLPFFYKYKSYNKSSQLLIKQKLAKIKHQFRATGIDRFTSFLRKDPDFMLIGLQKCGTTSLEYYMTQHPDIFRTKKKETQFFNKYYHLGINYYRSFFAYKWSKKISGDYSALYFTDEETIHRIKKTYPNMKFILSLRDPTDRAYSEYHMRVRGIKVEKLSFEDAIKFEHERLQKKENSKTNYNFDSLQFYYFSYTEKGKYHQYLEHWFKHFPKENFLIINFDTEFDNLPKLLSKIFKFLELDEYENIQYKKKNIAKYPPMSPEIRKQLDHFFAPYQQKLNKLLESH